MAGTSSEPVVGNRNLRPTDHHRAKAQELLDRDEMVNPDDIEDPLTREAYVHGLFNEEFKDSPERFTDPDGTKAAAAAARQPTAATPADPGRAARGRTGGPGRTPSARPRGKSKSSWPHPTLTPAVSDGTGFALGMVLYALGLNYLRYGPAGVKGWLSAKFFNKPDTTLTSKG